MTRLRGLMPESRGFFVNTEMLTRARQIGLAVGEIGVKHRSRRGGISKVRLSDIPKTLGVLIPFWWKQLTPSEPQHASVWRPAASRAA